MTDAERIAARIREEYREVRILPDGTVAALGDLLYTRAVFLDCDMLGFEQRYCFEDRELATATFHALQSADDEVHGYTAARGRISA